MAAEMARQLGIDGGQAEVSGTPVGHPLVDRCVLDTPAEREYATRFSRERHWLLDEHRVRGGEALIPGTGYLDIVRAAFSQQPHSGAIELRDITFLAPFVVLAGHERELRVHFKRLDDGGHAFVVRSAAAHASAAWTDHVRGQIESMHEPRPVPMQPAAIAARCTGRSQVFSGDEQSVSLQFGPRWSNRQRIDFGDREALVKLALPSPFEADLRDFELHPALMDMATAGAQALIPGYDEQRDFFVPASYGRVTLHGALTSAIVSHVRLRDDDSGDDLAAFDITIADASGAVLVEISEFTMIRVRDKASLAAVPAPAIAPARPHATANNILSLGLREGIRTAEGADILRRVLGAAAGPQIVVSPQDLGALISHLRAPSVPQASADAGAGAGHAAPSRDASALEAALVAHEAVREAAASAHGDRVLAYVVYDPDHSITVSELRRHVRAAVPEDLVPQTIIELDALPRLADGSVDRAALPNPFAAEEAAVGPRNEMERAIATLWQELLGVDAVGVHDNFFDIGGHSLLSVRFISRLDKKVGVRLLHEHVVVNTLEQLAGKCAQMLGGLAPAAAGPVVVTAVAVAEPPAEAAEITETRKPRGLFGAVKQAVLGR